MKVVIVEDEVLAVERLEELLRSYDEEIEVIACLDSVRDSVRWFDSHAPPDLAFFDIQLADGLSFQIFEQVDIACPVVFTTAYDNYTLKAFKVNSIDYLLKPVNMEDLARTFAQYRKLKKAFSGNAPGADLSKIRQAMEILNTQYKRRFMVKAGHHLSSVPVEEVAYFYHENRIVWLVKKDSKKHAVDYTLEQLESLLDPLRFFRLNRKYLAAYRAIAEVVSYSNSRLKVILTDPAAEPVVVSREKTGELKEWLDQ